MLHYETLMIINHNLAEEDVNDLSQKVKQGMEDLGAKIINLENWGKRRLTYEVKKSKKGYYLIYNYSVESPNFLKKLDGMLRYNEDVLKYMSVKTKKETSLPNESPLPNPEKKVEGKVEREVSENNGRV